MQRRLKRDHLYFYNQKPIYIKKFNNYNTYICYIYSYIYSYIYNHKEFLIYIFIRWI